MDLEAKLAILADAAKYDASCASSGSRRANDGTRLGDTNRIGIYPRAGFVHVDVRPPPSYRWTDFARSDPDNPDKRPPKGWKRRKLTS